MDENEEIKNAYFYDKSTLKDVEDGLLRVVNILDGYHAMIRFTFFKGFLN